MSETSPPSPPDGEKVKLITLATHAARMDLAPDVLQRRARRLLNEINHRQHLDTKAP
jgi:hypothetical protein